MSSINWQIPAGTALWCTGVAAAGVVGALFSKTMVWDIPLAMFSAWTGLLAFAMTWTMSAAAIRSLVGIVILMSISSIFGAAMLFVAGPWALPLGTSLFLSLVGGSLAGSGIR